MPHGQRMLRLHRFIMHPRRYTSTNQYVGSSASNSGTAMVIEYVGCKFATDRVRLHRLLVSPEGHSSYQVLGVVTIYIRCTAWGANSPIPVNARPVTASKPATQASAIMPVIMVADANTIPIWKVAEATSK